VTQDDQAVEQLKREHAFDEQIQGSDASGMIAEESLPTFGIVAESTFGRYIVRASPTTVPCASDDVGEDRSDNARWHHCQYNNSVLKIAPRASTTGRQPPLVNRRSSVNRLTESSSHLTASSTNQSLDFAGFGESIEIRACDSRSRMHPESVSCGAIPENPANPIRARNWKGPSVRASAGRVMLWPRKGSLRISNTNIFTVSIRNSL